MLCKLPRKIDLLVIHLFTRSVELFANLSKSRMSSSYLQLSITAEALKPRRFGLSKPNPIAVAYIISPSGDDECIGRTEV